MANLINIVNKTTFDVLSKDKDVRFQALETGAKWNEVDGFYMALSDGSNIEQISLPDCDKKYWRLSDDEKTIIEMSDDEKEVIDKAVLYNSKIAEFEGKSFRVTILTDPNAEIVAGYQYFKTAFPEVYDYVLCKKDSKISTDIDETNFNGYAFLNDFVSSALTDSLKADESGRIKIEYVETWNPNNSQWYQIDYQTSETWINL